MLTARAQRTGGSACRPMRPSTHHSGTVSMHLQAARRRNCAAELHGQHLPDCRQSGCTRPTASAPAQPPRSRQGAWNLEGHVKCSGMGMKMIFPHAAAACVPAPSPAPALGCEEETAKFGIGHRLPQDSRFVQAASKTPSRLQPRIRLRMHDQNVQIIFIHCFGEEHYTAISGIGNLALGGPRTPHSGTLVGAVSHHLLRRHAAGAAARLRSALWSAMSARSSA